MEVELIAWLRERLPPHPLLRLGPGDDAALIALDERGQCLATVDMLMDGVDFRLAEADPRRVGRKALAVNLSDLAAMAGRPVAALVALALPRQHGFTLAQQLYEGMLPLADRHQVAIAGGDTNSWDGPLCISITVLGQPTARGPLRRSAARSGDWIIVTGAFGGSIHGRHFDFEPRVDEALLLHDRYTLHAGIDVSDGLALDLARLAQESGCGAALNLDRVPIADAARRDSAGQHAALERALGDGEDFELILAVPPDDARRMLAEQPLKVPLTHVGQFVTDRGLWCPDARGELRPLAPTGYLHELSP